MPSVTGLSPEYAEFDGTPHNIRNHGLFYSDAYRTAANIALDYEWFGADKWACAQADSIQKFFGETVKGREDLVYRIDGTPVTDPGELVREVDGTPQGVLHGGIAGDPRPGVARGCRHVPRVLCEQVLGTTVRREPQV